MEDPTRVVVYGLGLVGCSMAREVLRRESCELLGAIDRDPAKVGLDLGALFDPPSEVGLAVRGDSRQALKETAPEVVVLTTTSSLERIVPQIREIVESGANVVTTCEELSFPWSTRPDSAREIDQAAKGAGVSVLSTGVNPGFLMDFLPATVSGLCREVKNIAVERIQDAGQRRVAFQNKIGSGLTRDEFRRRVARGELRHVGLPESVSMIAAAVGWELSRVTETIEPVVATSEIKTSERIIAGGLASGVEQIGRGFVGEEERITLTFRAAVGEAASVDRVVVDGTPAIDLTIQGGVHGDLATCNVVVNAIPAVIRAAPGLRTMLDLGSALGPGQA